MVQKYVNVNTGFPEDDVGEANLVARHGFCLRGEFAPVPNTQSLTGNKTIAAGDPFVQYLSPTANRNVTMPAVTQVCAYLICNMSGTFSLAVKDASAAAIGTILANQSAWVISDGTTWSFGLMLGATPTGLVASGTIEQGIPLNTGHLGNDWRNIIGTTPGSGVYGLSATEGAALLGNQASGNTKTDVVQYSFTLPGWYVAGSAITVRLRAKQTTTLLTVGTTIVCTVKVLGDTIGSDLNTTSAITLTTSLANCDFVITPTSRVPGETLSILITTVANDTGGTVNTAPTITKVAVRLG